MHDVNQEKDWLKSAFSRSLKNKFGNVSPLREAEKYQSLTRIHSVFYIKFYYYGLRYIRY